jgi:predicted DNA-binding ribbon-helix-helix protein
VEGSFWAALREIADTEGLKLTELIAHIDKHRKTPNLSSAIRLYVLDYYARLAKEKAKPWASIDLGPNMAM